MKRILVLMFCLTCSAVFASVDIAVVTIDGGRNTSICIETKRQYCLEHGYDFIHFQGAYHNKILSILKVLENPSYKWVVWMDADTVVMNRGILLEDIIDEKFQFIISKDYKGISSGIFFIKVSEMSKQFLHAVFSLMDKGSASEDGAIDLELQNNAKFRSNTKIVPQRLFNAYPRVSNPGQNSFISTYQYGDFILNFSTSKRFSINERRKYLQMAVDNRDVLNLDRYLEMYGFRLSPLHSHNNEGYMSEEQKQMYKELLKQYPYIKSIAEIGLNAGHSADNFFQSVKGLKKFVSFDINMHSYTRVAVEYLSGKHGDRFKFVEGDSLVTVPKYAADFKEDKFDLIYIDGNHTYEYCLGDILNCRRLAHAKTVVWIDDYNFGPIREAVAQLQMNGLIDIINEYVVQGPIGGRCWVEIRYRFIQE